MKQGMLNVLLVLAVMSLTGCNGTAMPEPSAKPEPAVDSPSDAQPEKTCELTPPSFGVFESESMWQLLAGSPPLTPKGIKELSGQLAAIPPEEDSSAASPKAEPETSARRDPRYICLPALLFRAKHLFKEPPWTEEEVDLAIALADMLSNVFDRPEFQIDKRDGGSVKQSLVQIKTWFEESCHDNQIFPSMLATFDDGPFFGQAIDQTEPASFTEIARTAIPEMGGWLVVSRKATPDEFLVLEYRDSTERSVWSRRISAGSEDIREPIRFSDAPIEYDEGLGFKVNMVATWTYGTERMHVYLDEEAGFRFFFISW